MVSISDHELTQRASLVGILLAATAPCIGIVVVLERPSMTDDTLFHTGFAGAAANLVLGINPILGTAAACIVAALSIKATRKETPKYFEFSIATILSTGVGLADVSSSFVKSAVNFSSFLFGSVITISGFELTLICCISTVVPVCFLVLYRELLLITLDERVTRLAGVLVKTVNFIFIILTVVTVSAVTRTVDVLIISSLIVILVTCATQIARNYRQTVL